MRFPAIGVAADTLPPFAPTRFATGPLARLGAPPQIQYERRGFWPATPTPARPYGDWIADAPADHFLRYVEAEGRDFHLGEGRSVLWSRTAKAVVAPGLGLIAEFNMGHGPGVPAGLMARDFARQEDSWVIDGARVARIAGLTVPFGHFGAPTFGHTVLDGLMQVWLWRDALIRGQAMLGHWGDLPAWLDPALTAVGVGRERRRRFRGRAVLLERAGLSSALAAHGVYFPNALSRPFFDWLRATFAAEARPSGALYLRRSVGLPRPVLNAAEVEAAAIAAGFTPISLETLPFAEQVRLLASAERVMSPFGSGLTLAPLIGGRRQVIELLPSSVTDAWFTRQAAVHELDYRPILTPSRDDGAMVVDIDRIRRAMAD